MSQLSISTSCSRRCASDADAARGSGDVEFRRVDGRTAIVRARSSSPLKLLTPRSHGGCGWLVTSTYGGGLVDGDDITITATAGEGTRCLIGTQASTKVYRTPVHGCRQSLDVRAAAGSIVVVAPDPIVCFTGAKFAQEQRFQLSSGAGLVMVDWLTSGRWACGERWAFSSYHSRTEVRVDAKPVYRDTLLLDPADGPIAGPMRMGRFDCFATVLVIGSPLKVHAEALVALLQSEPAPASGAALIFAASPVPDGVVIRVAGSGAETVGRWIRDRLSFVPGLVGEDPWQRRS